MNTVLVNTIEELHLDKSKWKLTKFGDVAIQQKGTVDRENTELTRYIQGGHMNSEDLHIRNWGNLTDEYLGPAFIRKFEKGDILYGSRRTYLRKVAIADFDGITSNTTFVIKGNEANIDRRLLPFIMMSEGFTENSIKNSKGSVNPYINWKDIANYEFLLPPKDQQAKLAELLWAMDEVIERENDLLGKLLITNETQCKSSVDFGYNSNKLKLPDGWRMMKIKDFSTVQAGSTPLRSNTEFFNKGIHPWVKTLDLNNDSILSTEEKITDLALEKTSCKLREVGTILVAMYGGFNQIGRTGLLEIEAATNQAISAVMMDQNIVLPEYLLLVLNTKINYWKKVAISSRKDPNITKVDVENFPVPVPSLAVQESILLKTNSILRSIESSKSKNSSSKALQKSLINQVF